MLDPNICSHSPLLPVAGHSGYPKDPGANRKKTGGRPENLRFQVNYIFWPWWKKIKESTNSCWVSSGGVGAGGMVTNFASDCHPGTHTKRFQIAFGWCTLAHDCWGFPAQYLPTVLLAGLLWARSGMYGIRYLRVFDNVWVSKCSSGPANENEICPSRPQIQNIKPAHLSLPHDHCLATLPP